MLVGIGSTTKFSNKKNSDYATMKKIIFIVLAVSLSWSGTALAEWSVGSKLGVMLVKFDDADVEDDPISAGLVLGYRFKSWISGLSAELDVTRSVVPGTVENADFSVESQGIYLAYRTSHQPYFKVRIGFMDASLTGNLAEREGGETFGAGLGWRLNGLDVELDFTAIDDDINFASFGVIYHFR